MERSTLDGGQRLLALFNFTREEQRVALTALPDGLADRSELIGEAPVRVQADELLLPPYAAYWFSDAPG